MTSVSKKEEEINKLLDHPYIFITINLSIIITS